MNDIPGYEGEYAALKDGRIWSYPRKGVGGHGGLFKKAPRDKDGYLRVELRKNKKGKHFPVHRLIAKTYIPNPLGLPQVNHKNGVKDDNRVQNLEWCTDKENKEHSARNGLHPFGERSHSAKLTEKEVREILRLHNKDPKAFHMVRLARMFNVTPTPIYLIVHNKTWKRIEREATR